MISSLTMQLTGEETRCEPLKRASETGGESAFFYPRKWLSIVRYINQPSAVTALQSSSAGQSIGRAYSKADAR